MKLSAEMNYCRRCGTRLKNEDSHVYKCEHGHILFLNSSPAVGAVLFNDKKEVLVLERAIDPGKGMLDIPGGFCDGAETLEKAVAREVEEEVAVSRDQYGELQFILSDIDPYDYGGEVLPVTGVIFYARLVAGVRPVAADDAASVQFVPLAEIDLDKVYFPSIRAALQKMRAKFVV